MSSEDFVLNNNERKEIEKFYKYFTFKAVQVIVQSRLGEKIKTYSKPFSGGQEWFNLAIFDLPDVMCEVKRVVTNYGSRTIIATPPGTRRQRRSSSSSNWSSDDPDPLMHQQEGEEEELLIEISLKTVDEETMVLEVWHLGPLCPLQQQEPRSPHIEKVNGPDNVTKNSSSFTHAAASTGASCSPTAFGIYNKMAAALKSLLTLSRMVPAYRLARQQSVPESTFVVCYRLRTGPRLVPTGSGQLGNAPVTLKVAETPASMTDPGLSVWLDYRTDMTFSSVYSPVVPVTVEESAVYRSAGNVSQDNRGTAQKFDTGNEPQLDSLDRSVIDSMFDPESYKVPAFAPSDLYAATFKTHYDSKAPPFNLEALEEKPQVRSEPCIDTKEPLNKNPETRETSKSSENVTKIVQPNRHTRYTSSSEPACSPTSANTKVLDLELSEPLKAPFGSLDPGLDAIAFYRLVQKVPDLTWFTDQTHNASKQTTASISETLASLRSQFTLLEERSLGFDNFASSLQVKSRQNGDNDLSNSHPINA